MVGPNFCLLNSLLIGAILIPITLFLTGFPKASLESIIFGSVTRASSLSSLKTLIFIFSEELVFISIDTSSMLSTLLPSTDTIMSFFFKPALSAGLSTNTSSIFAGVKSFPTNI